MRTGRPRRAGPGPAVRADRPESALQLHQPAVRPGLVRAERRSPAGRGTPACDGHQHVLQPNYRACGVQRSGPGRRAGSPGGEVTAGGAGPNPCPGDQTRYAAEAAARAGPEWKHSGGETVVASGATSLYTSAGGGGPARAAVPPAPPRQTPANTDGSVKHCQTQTDRPVKRLPNKQTNPSNTCKTNRQVRQAL